MKIEEMKLLVVDSSELERKIEEVYGVDEFSFPCDQETSNDTCKEFRVNPDDLDDYDEEQIKKFKDGEEVSFMAGKLLDDMARKDIIPKGRYLIRVSW